MKFRCERDVLLDALATAARAAGRGGSTGLPGGVRMEVRGDVLECLATDSELGIETLSQVSGVSDGSCVVQGRLTLDIVRALAPGAVTIEADDEEARISSGRSNFNVRTSPEADFPKLAKPEGKEAQVSAADLAEALRQVVRAASSDMERPSLTGVLLAAEEGGLRLVATDSYRLAVRDLGGAVLLEAGKRVLLPARSLGELQRLLGASAAANQTVAVQVGEVEASFVLDGVRLTTRLLRAEFPEYARLIPSSYPNRLVIAKEPFLEALRRVRLLVRDVTSSVRMTMRADRVELVATASDVGQAAEDVDATYEGQELLVAFNPTFLIDGIEAIPSDEILIETLDGAKPALIRAVDSIEYRYVLMPVRVA